MLLVACWKCASTECQLLVVFHFCKSRHYTHIRAHNSTIDHLDRQKYTISKEKHRFPNNWYRKLQNMQKQILGHWIHDFDKTQFSHCKTRALYECIAGPTGRPADNSPNSDRFRDFHQPVPVLMVRVCWQSRPQFWRQFCLHPDPDLKWWSGTIANTYHYLHLWVWISSCDWVRRAF